MLSIYEQSTHFIPTASKRTTRYTQKRSASPPKMLMMLYFWIWNVASARAWDFTAQMFWRYCAFAHLRGNIDLRFYWFQHWL